MKEQFKQFYPLNLYHSSCSLTRGVDTDLARLLSGMESRNEGFVFGARMPIRPEPKGFAGRKLACGRRAALDQRDACVSAKNKPAFNFMPFKVIKSVKIRVYPWLLLIPVKKTVKIRVNQCQKNPCFFKNLWYNSAPCEEGVFGL